MEIEAVTEKVRERLKTEGVVGRDDETVFVFDSFSWTEAQKKNSNQYEPGQRLRFIRKTKLFDRGETVEVITAMENGLRVCRADGTDVDFIPHTVVASFDVGESRELKVAAGDWLLLQANAPGFVNGERVQVREIHRGRITLADGRELPDMFNAFTHGYAVTSHSSQSKTVDDVLVVASSRSFGAVNREQFYVSISRGREGVHVFTDDTELLARRVGDSHERKAAIELQALRDDLAKLGFVRKVEQRQENATPSVTPRQDFRAVRAMRQSTRMFRPTRLSPVQRIAQTVEDVRRWLDERFGVGQEQPVTETFKQTESVKQTQSLPRKLGRRITPSRDTGHSHGIHL
jgi:hypothetical protein